MSLLVIIVMVVTSVTLGVGKYIFVRISMLERPNDGIILAMCAVKERIFLSFLISTLKTFIHTT